ncbi:MAG: L-fucose:H+ symporter permease [Planctomycetota bacterium]
MQTAPGEASPQAKRAPVVASNTLISFALVTFCFALWGFANDITNPLVKAFGTIFNQSTFISAFVQFAFYGGYCFMAIPAAIFIKRYTFKSGILVGLVLYAVGGMAFIPASWAGLFWPFCAAFFVMTCGLSFLETSANPYILSMGDESTATQRLNLAQSFNPIGSISGAWVAKTYILEKINPLSSEERAALPMQQFNEIKMSDLGVVRAPYVTIGIVIAIVFVLIWMWRMPQNKDAGHKIDFGGTLGRLLGNPRYRESVIAQAFYVGAQITVWTYIVHYGTLVFIGEGLEEAAAAAKAQNYAIYSLLLFAVSRFVCTFLLKYLNAGRLLAILAAVAVALCFVPIFVGGKPGLYALVGVSGCMSLMFPTIYGIGLRELEDDAKLAAAGLVMAIAGGSILPLAQGYLIDSQGVQVSFFLPLLCFVVIVIFGIRVMTVHDHRQYVATSSMPDPAASPPASP